MKFFTNYLRLYLSRFFFKFTATTTTSICVWSLALFWLLLLWMDFSRFLTIFVFLRFSDGRKWIFIHFFFNQPTLFSKLLKKNLKRAIFLFYLIDNKLLSNYPVMDLNFSIIGSRPSCQIVSGSESNLIKMIGEFERERDKEEKKKKKNLISDVIISKSNTFCKKWYNPCCVSRWSLYTTIACVTC